MLHALMRSDRRESVAVHELSALLRSGMQQARLRPASVACLAQGSTNQLQGNCCCLVLVVCCEGIAPIRDVFLEDGEYGEGVEKVACPILMVMNIFRFLSLLPAPFLLSFQLY